MIDPASIAIICLSMAEGVTLLVAWWQHRRIIRLEREVGPNYMNYQTRDQPGDWSWLS